MSVKDAVDYIVPDRSQGDSFWVMGDHYRIKVSSGETLGSLAVIEIIAFPQNGPPPHIHHYRTETKQAINRL
jgi:hypothetical protein